MIGRIHRHWSTARSVALTAILLLVQLMVALLPLPDATMAMADGATTAAPHAEMPCDHGDCCDEDAPEGSSCGDSASCAAGDCSLRAVASLPPQVLMAATTLPAATILPADAPRWLLTRHDTPLLRPPIPA